MNQAKIKIYVDSGSYILLDVHNHLPPYSITMSNSDSPLQANSFTVYLPEFLAQSLKEVKIFILIYPRVKNKHLLISWLSACIERPRVAPPWHCTDCCFRWRCGDTCQCRGATAATIFIGAQLNQHRYLGPGSDIVSVRAAAVNTCHLPTQGYKN